METVECDFCGSSYKTNFEVEVSEIAFRFYRHSRNINQEENKSRKRVIGQCDAFQLISNNSRCSEEELTSGHLCEKNNWKQSESLLGSA